MAASDYSWLSLQKIRYPPSGSSHQAPGQHKTSGVVESKIRLQPSYTPDPALLTANEGIRWHWSLLIPDFGAVTRANPTTTPDRSRSRLDDQAEIYKLVSWQMKV